MKSIPASALAARNGQSIPVDVTVLDLVFTGI